MFSAKLLVCFFVALLGFVNFAAAATPPACLIAIIGEEPNPNDVATICKKDSIVSDISSNCGSEKSDAMTAYASVCKEAGVTVSTSVSASATKTGTSSASATGSASATSGSSSTASASSGSSAAASTSGATTTPAPSSDAPNKIQNVGLMALCAGLFGVSAVGLL
ncbi:putative gpi anchored cell wall protein [Lasiodiplodia theobromae]|uniref:Uncharacterized protein n=1 Tax=Lasiodiplodia theobromae TaxID=45133 RepID=A0A5N5DBC8_9PEZI|nr:GPI anchored cell wall protein [Lasiodiplodia theobromae]KAB2575098.1 hypothetical protein DBV05_g6289 [Lasiodiplodia theobromae]KAF4538962.1 GPI anchored cell wall protein [Lasiodiplodia theobromae]KAF9637349.1 putative gpi anchored cell wall protein [Lasiodiplodia theobromae]